ncbi:MAG: deoxynucleoside kinase [Saprospiraceae bacterium]|nr:deoxynucleoside kinase [Saprospiraceae bacterium]MCB9318515.1 deoxynucleoside kinase [Lewinellaceae bacterium]
MSQSIPHQYICIEGNIGAGKTTLCQRLAQDFNCNLVLEEFTDNPFLPHFYKDPDRFALPLELFFMTERHKQLEKSLIHQDLFHEFIVADYFFLKTLLFAKNNLKEDEYRLFQRMFFTLANNFPNPDLLIYLHRSPANLLKNIAQRGRQFEAEIQLNYLQALQDIYFEYFRSEVSFPIIILDADRLDFLSNDADYDEVKNLITRTYQPGVHRIQLIN